QALALIFSTLFIGQQPLIGGTNGLTNFSTILGQPLSSPLTQIHLYQATVLALVASYLLTCWLTASYFGKLLIAIRDSEDRTRFCGYDPTIPKVIVFAIAAGMAGLGGALFVPQVGIVNPDSLGTVLSMTMVVWVAVGGRGSLVGAIVGALFVNLAQSTVSESFPNAWQYFIGLIFIVTVLLFPSGLAGIPELIRGQLRPMPFHVGSAQAGERVGAGSALPATNTRPTIEPKEVSS
ncbi:MAG TPA: urea ABC transporter permease subunit UrtC, partial [Chloroflexota bacterium]|nr:urea ABC transporter permease subunit UrtC [Chloroflexota bacterium]